VLQQNCPYLVTFDFDLEHIVDAHPPVCKFGEDPTIWLGGEAILTDQRHRRTDGQMDAGQLVKCNKKPLSCVRNQYVITFGVLTLHTIQTLDENVFSSKIQQYKAPLYVHVITVVWENEQICY